MSLTLSEEKIVELTGYRRTTEQLRELHRQGFHRARRCPVTGRAILEAAHYEAVCAGTDAKPGPKLRPPRIAHA